MREAVRPLGDILRDGAKRAPRVKILRSDARDLFSRLPVLEPTRRNDNRRDDNQEEYPHLDNRKNIIQDNAAPPREGVDEARSGGDGDGDAPDCGTGEVLGPAAGMAGLEDTHGESHRVAGHVTQADERNSV